MGSIFFIKTLDFVDSIIYIMCVDGYNKGNVMISLTDEGLDLPVGEQFRYKGLVVEAFVADSHDCAGCCFTETECDRYLVCNDHERIDKTDVKFKGEQL